MFKKILIFSINTLLHEVIQSRWMPCIKPDKYTSSLSTIWNSAHNLFVVATALEKHWSIPLMRISVPPIAYTLFHIFTYNRQYLLILEFIVSVWCRVIIPLAIIIFILRLVKKKIGKATNSGHLKPLWYDLRLLIFFLCLAAFLLNLKN